MTGTWVRRAGTEPARHECAGPYAEHVGDLWRCACGRLWRWADACALCYIRAGHERCIPREAVAAGDVRAAAPALEAAVSGWCKGNRHADCDGVLHGATGFHWWCACRCHPDVPEPPEGTAHHRAWMLWRAAQ